MASITLSGSPVATNGELPPVGSKAPDFSLVDNKLNDVSLKTYAGKKKILNIVVSLDTLICEKSAKKFNEYAASHDDTVVLVISADLPATQARFCKMVKLSNITTLSMMRSRKFAKDYGVLLTDGPLAGVTARAVVVLNEDDKVIYTQLVPEIAQEPDYESALQALNT